MLRPFIAAFLFSISTWRVAPIPTVPNHAEGAPGPSPLGTGDGGAPCPLLPIGSILALHGGTLNLIHSLSKPVPPAKPGGGGA